VRAAVELARDRPFRDLYALLGHQHARQIARYLEQRARAGLPMGRDARLKAQARGELARDEPDSQHHRERQQILDVRDRERHARRDEEEVERGDVDRRRPEPRGLVQIGLATTTTASRNSMTMLARSKIGCSGVAISVVIAQMAAPHRYPDPALRGELARARQPRSRLGGLPWERWPLPTSIRSNSGASSASRLPSVSRCHQPRGLLWPISSFDRL
jgi:hypothetical protein